MREKTFKDRYEDLFVDLDNTEISPSVNDQPRQRSWGKIVAIGTVLLLIIGAVLLMRFWRINDIYVEGIEPSSKDYVLSLAGLRNGVALYQYKPNDWKQSIETDPHLSVETIDFQLPNKITIQIKERQEYAVIQSSDQYVYIDQNGYVLDISNIQKDASMFLIRGLSLTGYAKNEMLGVRDEYQLYVLSQLLQALQTTGQRGWYVMADLTNPVEIAMRTNSNMVVRLGSIDEIEEKLISVSAILNKLETDKKKSGTIDAIQPNMISYTPASASSDIEQEEMGAEENSEAELIQKEAKTAEIVEPTQAPVATEKSKKTEQSDENALFNAIPQE